MQTTAHPRSLTDRMKGAAFLDVDTYEEVEHDESATSQAALVVAITAVTQAIGAAAGHGNAGRNFIGTVIVALIAWWLSAGITYFVGTRLFGGTATWGEVARTLGFANSPSVLAVFGFVPGLGRLLLVVLSIWVLVARIIAIRQALDFDTGKAIATAFIGWLVAMIPIFLLAMLVMGAAIAGGMSRAL
ncbi:MAG TPA: YIP1 family protein [Gemmatimonadaceae bacterium]|nr:YIP1 family protein [Gemmatimonadaceae bacterium]